MTAPTLIIGYGNPSRGDDALGPAAIEAIERLAAGHPEWGDVETVTDFQLQIEFVTDLAGRERIVFIDAAANGTEPFFFGPLVAKEDASISSHALSPAALLAVYRNFHGEDAPPAFLLGIRGYDFDLGVPLSPQAEKNLAAALSTVEKWLSTHCTAGCHA
ncbi:hydrogenase maturation protease [Noviherbaspirillum sp. ST9]|uniref:hydrogenase maturation protease n=1 Tax=Noviherbaspirillum sp. ST9 TaxID=3401606 RepID=UPI003B587D64